VQSLDRGIVTVWTVAGLLGTAPLLLAALVLAAAIGPALGGAVLGVWVVAAVLAGVVVPRWRFRHTGWSLEDGVLQVRRGAVLRSHAAVPVFRIQHVDLAQGPLDRAAGVQSLTVHTAAPAADVLLPGLRAEDAEALRAHLLDLAREAVDRHDDLSGTRDGV
jgi:uncharacterized protein